MCHRRGKQGPTGARRGELAANPLVRVTPCALAATARGITKIPTAQRGLTTRKSSPETAKQRRTAKGREGGERNELEAKEGRIGGAVAGAPANAARGDSRRDVERRAVRDVVDARRTGQADAVPAGEHLRAVAAPAEALAGRAGGGEALPRSKSCD